MVIIPGEMIKDTRYYIVTYSRPFYKDEFKAILPGHLALLLIEEIGMMNVHAMQELEYHEAKKLLKIL